MFRLLKALFVLICLVVTLAVPALAGDDLGPARYDFRNILKNVSNEVAKNFYDPKLKGADWKTATDEARKQIDAARSINEMELAIFQLLEKLDDSHTFFIPPASAVEMKYGFDAQAYGDEVRVYEVDRGSAAEEAGLKVGDRIRQINGYEVERDTADKLMIYTRKLYQISPMNLLVQRQGKILTIPIYPKRRTRAVVLNRSSNFNALWAMALDDFEEWQKKYGTYRYGMQENVGYFQVREFPAEGEDFLKGVAEKTRASNAVIIDLRDSPGGVIKTLLSFAGLFQENESDMAMEVGRVKSEPLKIKPRRPYMPEPLFILVDSSTASASEMLARHLQKTRKATIIGDKTAGAVTIAKIFDGQVGAGMVTQYGIGIGISRVVFPDGEELEKKGITPDVLCIPTQQDMIDGKDVCLEKAFELAKAAGKTPVDTKAAAK